MIYLDGGAGGRTSATGPGAPSARTTAPTATPGTTCRTTWPAAKAYRWGEDGIAGICDRYQLLCFAPAFWNGATRILKERLFGVTPHEGNHGEDVKEYYFHLDNTPTHSYMKFLYKYPQAEFPYRELIEENRRRAGQGPEFELLDTGIFDDDRYFDIFDRVRQGRPGGHCDPDRGVQPRPRRRRRCTSCRTSGSATPGRWGRRRGPSRDQRRAERPDGAHAW